MAEPDLFDPTTLFRRMRLWVPSGLGMMSLGTIRYQMGGRRGVDPYGWPQSRIDAAFQHLVAEGAIEPCGLCGEYCVTDFGVGKYEVAA